MHEPNISSVTNMKNEIVKAGDGNIHLSSLGVQFDGDIPEQSVDDLLHKFGSVTRGCMFIIGDTINFSQSKWGEKYEHWMKLTGLEYQTLAHAASIARKVQFCLRRQKLTYDHHKMIAPLPPEEQKHWLDLAEHERMSSRRLRKSLLLGRPATDEDMEMGTDKGIENVHPYVNGVCGFWRKLNDLGWVKRAGTEKLRAFKRDLQPVVDIYNTLPD
jgi:hypothetical protein